MIQLNTSQREGLVIDDKNTLVIAGAGTGKTTLLTQRVLKLIADTGQQGGYRPEDAVRVLRQLVLVTFTEAAATELKERVRRSALEELNRQAETQREFWQAVNDHLDEAHIGTIDSFYRRLLLRHPEAARIAPGVAVVDEVVAEVARRQSVRETLDAAFGANPPAGLQEAASTVVGQFGYNRTADVLENLLQNGEEHLGLSFLLEEGREESLEALRQEVGQQLAEDISRHVMGVIEVLCELEIPVEKGKTATKIREQVAEFKRQLSREECWASETCLSIPGLATLMETGPPMTLPGNLSRDWTDDYRDAVMFLRDVCSPHQDAIAALQCNIAVELEALRPSVEALGTLSDHTVRRYQQWKRASGQLDFADLTDLTYRLLDHEEAREACRERYRHIWVDEFQDTSRAQAAILFTLAGAKGQPRYSSEIASDYQLAPGAFFAVGDPKQSIYRFREADVTVFLETLDKLEQDGQRVVDLEENFRSTRALVEYFNYCFQRVMAEPTQNYEARPQLLTPHRQHQEGPNPRVNFVVYGPEENSREYKAAQRREEEARHLARAIRTRVESGEPVVWDDTAKDWRPAEYRDFAILFQVTSNLSLYENALRDLNLPYYVHAGRGFFSVQEIHDIIHGLRILQNPADNIALVGWLRSPMVGISDAGLVNMTRLEGSWARRLEEAAHLEESGPSIFTLPLDGTQAVRAWRILTGIRRVRGSATLPELVRLLVGETDYAPVLLATWRGEQARANLDKLVSLADEMAASSYGLDEFIELIENRKQGHDREGEASLLSEDEGGVKLMTIHRSKGLEFPIVLLPDLVRDSDRHGGSYDYHRRVGTIPKTLDLTDPEAFKTEAGPLNWLVQLLEAREDEAERKRLLYVAATRARDALYCFIPRYEALKSGDAPGKADGKDLARLLTSTHPLADVGDATGGYTVREEYEGFEDETPEYVAPAFDTHAKALLEGEPLPGGDDQRGRELVARCVEPTAGGIVNRTFHATAVLTYAICPQRYEYKYIYGIPEFGILNPAFGRAGEGADGETGEEDPDDDRAAEMGTLVHNVLAEIDFNNPGDVAERVRHEAAAQEFLLGDEALERCVRHVRWVAESDYGRQLAGAEQLLREASFRVRWGSGENQLTLIGRLDGLFRKDGQWRVFDYKTNQADGDVSHLVRRYGTQLNIYQTAVEQVYPEDPVTAELVCTDYQEVVPVPRAPAFEEEVLPRLARGLLAEDYEATPTANCHESCPYAEICPAVRDRLAASANS